jgi:hypothetical protein
MRVLLDEQPAVDLRHGFREGFDVETAEYRGWKGVKNGALLRKAEAAGYEAFLTNDQSLTEQQDLSATRLRIIVLDAPTNKQKHHRPLVPKAEEALRDMQPGEVRRVRFE